jgi:hypothetical protein
MTICACYSRKIALGVGLVISFRNREKASEVNTKKAYEMNDDNSRWIRNDVRITFHNSIPTTQQTHCTNISYKDQLLRDISSVHSESNIKHINIACGEYCNMDSQRLAR